MTFSDALRTWKSPVRWSAIEVLDVHTAGEPLRVFTLDLPELKAGPVADRRTWALRHADEIRRMTMWEPRGHREMYGCIVLPPERPDSDVGVLFLHNEGFSTMCGHGIIALAQALVTIGMVKAEGPVTTIRIDTPAGLVIAEVSMRDDAPEEVTFENVPSFVLHADRSVTLEDGRSVRFDVAYGGAFYAYVDAAQLGLTCSRDEVDELVRTGREIKRKVSESMEIVHPDEASLGFLYGTIFTAPPQDATMHSRQVCIFADGQVDRSPTGTGVSGRLALLASRTQIAEGDRISIESILGTTFRCGIMAKTKVGPHDAVRTCVTGRAFVTGRQTLLIDPDDPLRHGFLI